MITQNQLSLILLTSRLPNAVKDIVYTSSGPQVVNWPKRGRKEG